MQALRCSRSAGSPSSVLNGCGCFEVVDDNGAAELFRQFKLADKTGFLYLFLRLVRGIVVKVQTDFTRPCAGVLYKQGFEFYKVLFRSGFGIPRVYAQAYVYVVHTG